MSDEAKAKALLASMECVWVRPFTDTMRLWLLDKFGIELTNRCWRISGNSFDLMFSHEDTATLLRDGAVWERATDFTEGREVVLFKNAKDAIEFKLRFG